MNKKIILLLAVITFGVAFCSAFTATVFADAGSTGGYNGSVGSSLDPVFDCTFSAYHSENGQLKTYGQYGRCPLWNKVTASTFASMVNSGSVIGNYSNLSNVVSICSNSSLNPDGIVIFAGVTSGIYSGGLTLFNLSPLPAKFITNYKITSKDLAYDGVYGTRRNFFGDTLSDGRTISQLMSAVMSNLGTNEANLAAFCMGMDGPTPPGPTPGPDPCTGCCPGDPYYENGCVPPDVPDPGYLTDEYDAYGNVYIGGTHDKTVSNSTYTSGYYVLDKTTPSTNVNFTSSLNVISYDSSVSDQTSDALSRATGARSYYQNGTGTYSLSNGEELNVCDGFRYPSYVRYRVHIIAYYSTVPVRGPLGNIIDYEPGYLMREEVQYANYDSLGSNYDSYICANIFREAEAIFGLESKGAAFIENILNYTWRTDTAHAVTSLRALTTSFPTGPITVRAATGHESEYYKQKIWAQTHDDEPIQLTYDHRVTRGLNTAYEAYSPYYSTISSPWDISYTIDGAPASSDTGTFTTSSSSLPSTATIQHTRDITSGDVPFGSYARAYCETLTHPSIARITVPISSGVPTVVNDDSPRISTTACLDIYRPWNFDLSITASLSPEEDETILVADGTESGGSARIVNNMHLKDGVDGYDGRAASRTPDNTKAAIYSFVIEGDVDESVARNSIFRGIDIVSDDIFASIMSQIPASTRELARTTETYTDGIPIGDSSAKTLNVSFSKSTSIDPGNKICVVAAVSYASSAHIADAEHGEGYGNYTTAANRWRTSNIACRTVTSKSLLQIVGGEVIAGGNIDVAAMKLGATTFNSWTDYGLVAVGDVRTASYAGISSGAFGAFGRDASATDDVCDIAHMTVASDGCSITKTLGKSGVYMDTKLSDSIMARYDVSSTQVGVTHYNVGSASRIDITYVDASGYPVWTETDSYPDVSVDPVSGAYYRLSTLEKQGGVTHADAPLLRGTEVIHVPEGTGLIIDQNLVYQEGVYLNPYDIPQRIIIVEDGNILVEHGVTRIDAWIVVKNGNLVTCVDDIDYTAGNIKAREYRSNYSVCDAQLSINGYVAADYIAFERTTFANPATLTDPSNRDARYMNYGERITLPYSSMIWAYNKLYVSSISQPSVVYTHTLAPRY